MKQVMFISALALIMVIGFGGDLSSKMHPDDFGSLTKPDGEDHPWGGEQWIQEDPLKSSQPKIPVITAYPLIDYFIALYLEGITINFEGSKTKSGAKSVQVTSSNRNIIAPENNNQSSSIRR